MTKKVLIGVPCYNGADDLLPGTLGGIRTRTLSNIDYNLVVVDDSGRREHQEKSQKVAEKFGAKWLKHDINKGITAAWNTLSRSGDEPIIILLNDDIVVSPGWLDSMVYFIENNPSAGAVGLGFYFIIQEDVPVLLSSPYATVKPRHYSTKQHLQNNEDPHLGMDYKYPNKPGRVMCPVGCSFGFSREKYNLVNGFDPATRNFYNESWFTTALAEKGFVSYMLPYPMLYHIWSATFARAPELTRNDPIDRDRQMYIKHFGGDFAYTDPKFMSKIPFRKVSWLLPDGTTNEGVIESKDGYHIKEGEV